MEFAARVQLIFVGLAVANGDSAGRTSKNGERTKISILMSYFIFPVVCSPIFILSSEIECCRCKILFDCSYLAGTPRTHIATRKVHNMPTITRVQRRILNARSLLQ